MIQGLPAELRTLIADHSEPHDVYSLSQTCRGFRNLLAQKSVWARALRSVCRKHALFPPSYPVKAMGLRELQHSALGPYRWHRLIQDNARPPQALDGPLLRPASTSVVSLDFNGLQGEKLFLVPGGRFLVTADVDSLRLWDIGGGGGPPLVSPVMVSRAAPSGVEMGCRISGLAVRAVGDALRVAVVYTTFMITARIYDIFPEGQDRCFQLVASINLIDTGTIEPPLTVLLDGDRLLIVQRCEPFRHAYQNVIWDFITGKYTYLVVEERRSEAMFTGDMIIYLRGDCILAWVVPLLDKDAGRDTAVPLPQAQSGVATSPDFKFPLPLKIGSLQPHMFSLPSGWGSSFHSPITFDLFLGQAGSSSTISVFRFTLDVSLTNMELLLLASFDLPPSPGFVTLTRANEDFGFGFSSPTVVVAYAPTPRYMVYSVSGRGRAEVMLTTLEYGLAVASSVSLCSASGRSAFYGWRTEGGRKIGAAYIAHHL